MKHRQHRPIKLEKINMSAEEINYLLSRIEDKISKQDFPNYHIPFSSLTPEQIAQLRGPQGNSGILGDINNIAIEAINDLNGDESTTETIKVLAAAVGPEIISLINSKTFCIGTFDGAKFTPACRPSQLYSALFQEKNEPFFYVRNRATLLPINGSIGMWNISPVHVGNGDGIYHVLFNYDYGLNVRVSLTTDTATDTFTNIEINRTILASDRTLQQTTGSSTSFPMSQKAVTDALDNTKKQLDGNISSLEQSLSDLERTVEDNKNELDEDIITLTEDVSILNPKVQTIGETVSNHNDDIAHLQGDVRKNTNNITALGSRIDALGGSFNQSLYLKKAEAAIANPSDITDGIDRTSEVTYKEKDATFISGGAIGSVLPFKIIDKTTLSNGSTIWYRLALNYPTGSSNGAHQFLLQYAETATIPTASDWQNISYINNTSLSAIQSAVNNAIKKSQIANNLTTTETGKVLDASQGKALNDKIAQAVVEMQKLIDEKGDSSADITGLLNLKNPDAVSQAQALLTKDGQTATYIITDDEGNYPSPLKPTVYLDDMVQLQDLLYKGNGNALKHLLATKEAYYLYLGTWYSQNIAAQVKLPAFNLTTARVGDLVTIIRHDFTAEEFYSKYIDFSTISNDNLLFQAYKASQGYGSNTDGEFIQHLITDGQIYSSPTNPEEDSTVTPVPLAVDGKVTFYTAQITPNTQNVYNGEFWSGNITAPGIYCYVTSGRPSGVPDGENFIGVVSPDGTKILYSMKNPNNTFILESGGWRRIGVGKNTGGTGEVFNDYANNYAHYDHAHAEGQNCRAESYNAHAEGYSTKAGWNAHSEGSQTEASGQNSHAEGDSTKATYYNAHAEGYRTHATGNGAHAEGNSEGIDDESRQNVASGFASHAEGSGTVASGDGSHAEGYMTTAQAAASHAEGIGTVTVGFGSHAEGRYNHSDLEFIHSVGMGTSDDDRRDAHTIHPDGKHYIYGIGGFDGTNHSAAKDLASVINKNVHLSFFTESVQTEEEGYEQKELDRTLKKRSVLYIESDQPLAGNLCLAKYHKRRFLSKKRKDWNKYKNRTRRIQGELTLAHPLFGYNYVINFGYELDRQANGRYIYKVNMSVKLEDGTVKDYSAISIDHLVFIELLRADPLTDTAESSINICSTSGNKLLIYDYTNADTDNKRRATLRYGFFLTDGNYSNDTEIFPLTIGIDSTIGTNKILAKNWRRWVYMK